MRAEAFSLPKSIRYLLIFFVVAAALAAFEQAWAHRRAQVSDPGRGADWIWAADVDVGHQNRRPVPTAFYAVRDLDLAELPKAAWLEITADEAYVLYLNGQWIGTGRYAHDQPADLYPVGELLRVGVNRIVVELRSVHGVGGLLASLRFDRRDRAVLRSGPAWRIFHRFESAFFDPDQLLLDGEAPQVWGGHGTGRWNVAPAVQRSLPKESLPAPRVRNTSPRAQWVDLRRPRRQFPGLGPMLIFDWGEVVTGHLTLPLDPAALESAPLNSDPLESGANPGLVYCHEDRFPDPDRDPWLMVRPIAGAPTWTSSESQRFRYCLTVGLPIAAAPTVEPAPPTPPPPPLVGVFKIDPPLKPVEVESPDVVWQRVQEDLRQARERREREKAELGDG